MSMQIFYKLMRTRESSCSGLLGVFIEGSSNNSSDKFIEQIFYHSFQILGSYDPDYKLLELVCKSLHYLSANYYHIKIALENNDDGSKYTTCYTRIALLAIDHLGQIISKALKCLCHDQKQISELSRIGNTFANITHLKEAKFYYHLFVAFKSLIYRKSKRKLYEVEARSAKLAHMNADKKEATAKKEESTVEMPSGKDANAGFYKTSIEKGMPGNNSYFNQAPTVILPEPKAKAPSRRTQSLNDQDMNEDEDEGNINISAKLLERAYDYYEVILLFNTKFSFCRLLALRNEIKNSSTGTFNSEDIYATKIVSVASKDDTKSISSRKAMENQRIKEFQEETRQLRKVYFKITKCVEGILRKLGNHKKTNSEISFSEVI